MAESNGTALAVVDGQAVMSAVEADALEQVVIKGDLAKLTPAERVAYYQGVCRSMGLNPLTQPFQYITLSGRLTLYATRGAADQLRKLRGISIGNPDITIRDGLVWVTVRGTDSSGRADTEVGAVPYPDRGGEAQANAVMKALTKAKRRLTLSMAGLGWLDESELDTVPTARPAAVNHATGEIAEPPLTNGHGRPEPAEPVITCEQAAKACVAVTAETDLAVAEDMLAAALAACKASVGSKADRKRLLDEFYLDAKQHVESLRAAAEASDTDAAIDRALASDDGLEG